MKMRIGLGLGAALTVALCGMTSGVVAQGTKLWTVSRYEEMERGTTDGVAIRSDGQKWEIVQGVHLTDFSRERITATETELKEEKALVSELLPK